MTPLLGRIAPVRAGRWNLCLNLLSVAVALSASMAATGGSLASPLLHTRVVVALMAWLITAAALHHYDPWADERTTTDDAMMVTVLCAAVATTLFFLNKLASGFVPVPRTIQTFSYLWPTTVLLRLLAFRHLARQDGPLDEVLVVGTGPLGRVTADDLERSNRRRVLGYLSFSHEARPTNLGYKFLGSAAELEAMLASMPVTEVYIAGNALSEGEAMQAVHHAPASASASRSRCRRPASASTAPGRSRPGGGRRLRPLPERSTTSPSRWRSSGSSTSSVSARGARRSSRRCCSWSPLAHQAHLARARSSSGRSASACTAQPFHMLKFRSMVVNAEELQGQRSWRRTSRSGPVFKMKNDPRITRVGRFIRKYSIDELPQLINVLRGDMSVVGPRPPVPSEVAQVRGLAAPPALGASRAHVRLAGQRPQRDLLRGVDVPRHAVHRSLEPRPGLQSHLQDRPGGAHRSRRELRRGRHGPGHLRCRTSRRPRCAGQRHQARRLARRHAGHVVWCAPAPAPLPGARISSAP